MKLATTTIFAATALFAAPAFAQGATAPAADAAAAPAEAAAASGETAATAPATASAKVTIGATVYDVSGGTVGTVESVEGKFAVVSTGKNKAKLPLESFAAGEKGPLLGMTREQLDAAASAAASKGS